MPPKWAGRHLTGKETELIHNEWFDAARARQYPIGGAAESWLVIGGRGAGKTRLGAEWVNGIVRGFPPFTQMKYGRLALVGETLGDVREVMIDGASGIMAVSRHTRPRFEPSRRRLVWDCGAVAQIFSAEDPESLRGPQFDAAWCDELAKWRHQEECFDMLQFGLRVGERPLQLMTTTPKPTRLLRRLIADPNVRITRMRTADNGANLPAAFLRAVERQYAGTRLGRQELDAELIEEREDALWSRELIERIVEPAPEGLRRIVVAVDPPAGSRRTSDACGIVVAARDEADRAVVLFDGTCKAAAPRAWAAKAVALYHRFAADCVVAEVNQGGEMVTAVIATVDAAVPVKPVRATRGKWLRAEPVAALYQQGRVRHAARFPELEDEMCDFGPDGLSEGRSPDRVDALVWAVTDLLLGRVGEPRIRDFGR